MKTRRTKNADATRDAVRHVAQVADAQRRIAETLTAAAAKVRRLEEAMHAHGERIETAVTREGADAAAVAKAMAEHRVRTGELSSRVVDALERRGQRLYPTPYTPIESPWALIENTNP
jgi:aldehyde:ferredoxin oxidoreductase